MTGADITADLLDGSNARSHLTESGLNSGKTAICSPGTVLVVTRTGVGRVGIATKIMAVSQDISPVECHANLDNNFLTKFLHSYSRTLIQNAQGATIQGITKKFLSDIPVPLPPLPEQKRIVAILDEAFAGIASAVESADANINNTDEMLKSRSNAYFSNSPNDWFKTTLGQLIDDGWIEDHMDGNHGGDYPRKSEFVETGVPYISANCLRAGEIDFTRAKYLTLERASKLRKGFARSGDVLFAHNATVGPVTILETGFSEVILGTSLTYYRCNKDRILPGYLVQYMGSPNFVSQYEQIMRQSTRNQIPITKQREFFHIIPPIADQIEISESLEKLNKTTRQLKSIYRKKLDALAELKQSILQQAFSGKLTGEPDKALAEAGL